MEQIRLPKMHAISICLGTRVDHKREDGHWVESAEENEVAVQSFGYSS